MNNGPICFFHCTLLKLPGKESKALPARCQQQYTAGLSVQAVYRVNAEIRAEGSLFCQCRIFFHIGTDCGTDIPARLVVNTYPRGFLQREPAFSGSQYVFFLRKNSLYSLPSIPFFRESSAGFSPSQMPNRAFLNSGPAMVPMSFSLIYRRTPCPGV